MNAWRLLDTGAAPGSWNMGVDEALVESVARGGVPILRLYGWSPYCLSFGRNQPARGAYDIEGLRAEGIDVVRRPTGGSAVLHARELTYAAVFPATLWGGPRLAYEAVHRALARGLRALGVEARTEAGITVPAGLSTSPCFVDRTRGEVEVGGRKLVGSAVRRFGQVLLQHGSLLIDNDQTRIPDFVIDGAPAPRAVSLRDLLPEPPEWESLATAIADAWSDEHGVAVRTDELTPFERTCSEQHAARYRDPDWTWRR